MATDPKLWLLALAAAFEKQLSGDTAREYIESLSEWKLLDRHWAEIKREAKYTCLYFPKIFELNEIRLNVLQADPLPVEPISEDRYVRNENGKIVGVIWPAKAKVGA